MFLLPLLPYTQSLSFFIPFIFPGEAMVFRRAEFNVCSSWCGHLGLNAGALYCVWKGRMYGGLLRHCLDLFGWGFGVFRFGLICFACEGCLCAGGNTTWLWHGLTPL